MNPVQMNAKSLRQILVMACVSVLLAGCGDSSREAETGTNSSGAPKELPNMLKIKRHKKTYVINGIGLSGSNKVAIINNQVLQPGMDVAPGVVLEDVQSTYAIIVAGNTKHLIRPGDIQRELDKKGR